MIKTIITTTAKTVRFNKKRKKKWQTTNETIKLRLPPFDCSAIQLRFITTQWNSTVFCLIFIFLLSLNKTVRLIFDWIVCLAYACFLILFLCFLFLFFLGSIWIYSYCWRQSIHSGWSIKRLLWFYYYRRII